MTSDRSIVVSVYPPRGDGRPTHETSQAIRLETTVGELLSSLLTHEVCANKGSAPAWSPIAYRGARRIASDAESVCAIVLDLDHEVPSDTTSGPPTPAQLESLSAALEVRQWRYAIHETYTPGRYRLTVPLSRDVTPREYPQVYARVCEALAAPADPSTGDLARLFYAPSHPEGFQRFSDSGGSALCDPADLGIEAGTRPLSPPKTQVRDAEEKHSAPVTDSPKIFDLQALHAEVAARSDDKRAGLQGLIDGTLRVPPGQRETLLHPLISALSWARNAPPDGVAEEMLRRVLSVRDGAETQLEEWVVKAMGSYTRGKLKKQNADAGVAVVEKFFRDESWREELKMITDAKGTVKGMMPIEHNVLRVLRNDENFQGHIRWNLLKQRMEVLGGVLHKEHENARDDLGVPLASYFQGSQYNCMASRELVGACLQHVALENGYDPVREWVGKLPKWDGVERLSTVLLKYAQAQGAPDWIRVVTRKFLIAAMARAMDPGCQVDNVLVLQGAQGGGKTSFVRVLGAGFHVETSLDLHNKDAVMTASGNWLVELGELASLKKSDVESVRNFITRREDQIRLPYGRAIKTMPRRCVFIGTTNSRQPLTDPEGNRRFWVVSVGTVDTAGLETVKEQIWAEALHAYRSGEKWWLDQKEAKRAAQEAKVYEAEDITETEILAWLSEQKAWPAFLTASEVASKVLHRMAGQMTSQEIAAINRTMANMGWERTRRRQLGRVVTCYNVPSRRQMEARGEQLDSESGMDKVTE